MNLKQKIKKIIKKINFQQKNPIDKFSTKKFYLLEKNCFKWDIDKDL